MSHFGWLSSLILIGLLVYCQLFGDGSPLDWSIDWLIGWWKHSLVGGQTSDFFHFPFDVIRQWINATGFRNKCLFLYSNDISFYFFCWYFVDYPCYLIFLLLISLLLLSLQLLLQLFLSPANNSLRGPRRLGAGNGKGGQPACSSTCQPERI